MHADFLCHTWHGHISSMTTNMLDCVGRCRVDNISRRKNPARLLLTDDKKTLTHCNNVPGESKFNADISTGGELSKSFVAGSEAQGGALSAGGLRR